MSAPVVCSVFVHLPPGVDAKPYRKAARALFPHAALTVYRRKHKHAESEVYVTMMAAPDLDRRVDSKPWDLAETAIVGEP